MIPKLTMSYLSWCIKGATFALIWRKENVLVLVFISFQSTHQRTVSLQHLRKRVPAIILDL